MRTSLISSLIWGAMETQRLCVTWAVYLWHLVADRNPLLPHIVSLVSLCIFWATIFYAYRSFELFFQRRQREAKQEERLHSYQSHSQTERDVIENICSEVQTSTGNPSPRVRKEGAAQEFRHLEVPVSIYQDSCTGEAGGQDSKAALGSLMAKASQLRALSGQETSILQACAGPVIHTRLKPLASDTDNINLLQEMIAKENRFMVQLGSWRVFLPSTGGSDEARLLKLDAPVPVILHSSYSGGTLTVEGLHLKHALIQAATKDKCITLETQYTAGSNGLEVFTSESGLPSNNLAEVFVLASKKIVVDEHELSVNSVAVRIQNENLRTVFWTIFCFTALVIYATNQILFCVMKIKEATNSASVLAWLWTALSVVIVSTQALPPRTEPVITISLKKLAVHAYFSLCFAAECFNLVKDPEVLCKTRRSSRPEDQSILNKKPSKEDSVDNPEWTWPIFDIDDKGSYCYYANAKLTKREPSENTGSPFEVIYRNETGLPWASQVQVSISSPLLIEIIKGLVRDKSEQRETYKKVLIDGPELFRIHEELREFQQTLVAEQKEALGVPSSDDRTSNTKKLLHLNQLLRFMHKEFEVIKPMYTTERSEGRVSWDMLWAIFPPDTKVVYIDPLTEEKLYGEIAGTTYRNVKIKPDKVKKPTFFVNISSHNYNGETWGKYSNELEIPKFDRYSHISSLKIYPFQYERDPEVNESYFLENGKSFCELSMMARNSFMDYQGSMNIREPKTWCIVKENADGRVMIDLGSFARLNPFYRMGNAQPPCTVIRNKATKTIDITEDETRMFAPAIVYGFSFSRKKWGSFSVCGFSPIDFNTSAYGGLVMNETKKEVLEKLVRKQLEDGKDAEMQDRDRVDPIARKGEGSILLCYGPPGTGKTLTAESLSEKLHCPLWCLSVSELGLTPKDLEETLVRVMDVAASWGAILLLDEADIFLERRTASDLKRNAMTGVFLRQIEYYRGVLFLTTNRESAFDDAIRSRVALFLYYERHNEDQRRKIWTNLFDRVGLKDVPSEDLEEFAKHEFNGREIRNIVKTAHNLSRSEDDSAKLEIGHVKTAFEVYKESSKLWDDKNFESLRASNCA